MVQIQNFAKTALPSATHLEVMQQFVDRVEKLDIAHKSWNTVRDQYVKAVQKEDADFRQQQGSDLTADIRRADEARDAAWAKVERVINAFRGEGSDAQTVAANQLYRIAQTYRIDTRAQYDKETTLLRQAIQDIEAQHIDLAALSLTATFAQLRTANDDVRRLLGERDDERASNLVAVLKADRAQTDAAYEQVILFINASLVLSATDTVADFAVKWNSVLNRIRVQVLGSSVQQGETVPTDGTPTDAPSTDTPSTDTPSNPGSTPGTQQPSGSGSNEGGGDEYDA